MSAENTFTYKNMRIRDNPRVLFISLILENTCPAVEIPVIFLVTVSLYNMHQRELIIMRKNTGCISIIFIILLLAGVRWIRFYALPIIVVFIIVAVVNGIKKNDNRKAEEKKESEKNWNTGYTRTQEQNRKTEYKGNDSTGTIRGTIITCDYCGSGFDTSKHGTCPHCGGPYWDDEEWKEIRRRNMC